MPALFFNLLSLLSLFPFNLFVHKERKNRHLPGVHLLQAGKCFVYYGLDFEIGICVHHLQILQVLCVIQQLSIQLGQLVHTDRPK